MRGAKALLTICTVLVVVVTTASAYLRLSHYGLGCADWPACYGQSLAAGATAVVAPAEDWVRGAHRVAATVVGLMFVVIAVLYWNRWPSGGARWMSVVPLLLAAFLSWLGRFTPSTLPAVTLGNLLGGMAVLAVLWWLRARTSDSVQSRSPWLRPAALGLTVLFFQIALGGLTSARLAAAACPAFPHCGGLDAAFNWSVANPFLDREAGAVAGGALQGLHMLHRIFGLAVAAYLSGLAVVVIRRDRTPGWAGWVLLSAVAGQVAVGAAMVLARYPLWLAVAHNLVAATLVCALVGLMAQRGRSPFGTPGTRQ